MLSSASSVSFKGEYDAKLEGLGKPGSHVCGAFVSGSRPASAGIFEARKSWWYGEKPLSMIATTVASPAASAGDAAEACRTATGDSTADRRDSATSGRSRRMRAGSPPRWAFLLTLR